MPRKSNDRIKINFDGLFNDKVDAHEFYKSFLELVRNTKMVNSSTKIEYNLAISEKQAERASKVIDKKNNKTA